MKCSLCGDAVYTLPIPGKATYCQNCYQDAYDADDPKRYAGIYSDTPPTTLPDPEPRLGLDVF